MYIRNGTIETVLGPNEANKFLTHIPLPDRDLNMVVKVLSFSIDETDPAQSTQVDETLYQISKTKGANPIVGLNGGISVVPAVPSGAPVLLADGSGLKLEATNPLANNVAMAIKWELFSSTNVAFS